MKEQINSNLKSLIDLDYEFASLRAYNFGMGKGEGDNYLPDEEVFPFSSAEINGIKSDKDKRGLEDIEENEKEEGALIATLQKADEIYDIASDEPKESNPGKDNNEKNLTKPKIYGKEQGDKSKLNPEIEETIKEADPDEPKRNSQNKHNQKNKNQPL